MSALSPLVSVSGVEGSEATRDTRHPTLSETVPAQTGLKNALFWKSDDCRQLWDGNFDAGVCMISRIPLPHPRMRVDCRARHSAAAPAWAAALSLLWGRA